MLLKPVTLEELGKAIDLVPHARRSAPASTTEEPAMPSSKPLAEYAASAISARPGAQRPQASQGQHRAAPLLRPEARRQPPALRLPPGAGWHPEERAVPGRLDPTVKRSRCRWRTIRWTMPTSKAAFPRHYGAGDVIVWDRGAWTPLDDPHEGLEGPSQLSPGRQRNSPGAGT